MRCASHKNSTKIADFWLYHRRTRSRVRHRGSPIGRSKTKRRTNNQNNKRRARNDAEKDEGKPLSGLAIAIVRPGGSTTIADYLPVIPSSLGEWPTNLFVSPIAFESAIRRRPGIQSKHPSGKRLDKRGMDRNPVFIFILVQRQLPPLPR